MHPTRSRRTSIILITALALAVPSMLRADLGARAREVRRFIESVVGDLDTLQISDDPTTYPQPLLESGEIDPFYATTPEKIALGKLLFHDPILTTNQVFEETSTTVSCATCHYAEAGFRSGQVQSFGVGGLGFTDSFGHARRRPSPDLLLEEVKPTAFDVPPDGIDNPALVAPSINFVAFFDELNWNGSANQPVLSDMPPVERQARMAIGLHRLEHMSEGLITIPEYRPLFEAAFPELAGEPLDILFNWVVAMRAIGSYERSVVSNQSPWDRFLAGEDEVLDFDELGGAELFFGKAGCVECHNGPALGSTTYHALGTAEHPGVPEGEHDLGRFSVSNDKRDLFKFRAMTVRQLAGNGPFFHGGSAATLEDVVRYKNAGIPDQDISTLSDLFRPLNLSEEEVYSLTVFLEESLYDPTFETRHVPDSVPSGFCFPNNDQVSRYDSGCDRYGDSDGDQDVDLTDFAQFSNCFTGSFREWTGDCGWADRDGDNDVDLADFAAFQTSFGPPWESSQD
jgi:cytochrome c peroxidase